MADAAFQTHGYNATAMHDVVRAAGVTGGALYHHFPSKKALGLAVIYERVARAVSQTWIEPVVSAERVADGIAVVFARIIDGVTARGSVRGCPLNNLALELSLADPELRRALQDVFDTWRSALAEKLESELTGADAETLADFVIAAYSGAMALAKTQQNPAPLAACAQYLARLLPPSSGPAPGAGLPRAP
jgi:TetR/AcrR family transcriptional regulator, lmrAB and yxaGH operons repressor